MNGNFESLFRVPLRRLPGLASHSQHRPRSGTHQSDRRACIAPATAKAGRITSALLVSLLPLAACAEAKVEIKAFRNPDWGRYEAFLAGMNEFESKKRRFAPEAKMAYRIYPLKEGEQMADTGIRIETDYYKIDVPVDSDGHFTLRATIWPRGKMRNSSSIARAGHLAGRWSFVHRAALKAKKGWGTTGWNAWYAGR